MITLAHINYAAVVVAALAYLGIGRLWYSKWFFPQTSTDTSQVHASNNSTSAILTRIISALVMSLAMAIVVVLTGSSSAKAGVILGVTASIGFIATSSFINSTYRHEPIDVLLINSGYHLAGCMSIAIIESLWRSV